MIGKGQVYKISSEHSDKCYIGSTERDLNTRFTSHKCDQRCMSKILFELGECKIEALEVLYNITKQELKIKEQYYLDLLKDKAVNKQNAHTTKEQRKQQRNESKKQYRLRYPDKIVEDNKKYYNLRKLNKDEINRKRRAAYAAKKENNPV